MRVSWVVAALLALVSVQPSFAADAQSATFRFGVNRPFLGRLPEAEWKGIVDAIAANGIKLLRTGPVDAGTPALVRYAADRGVDIVLVLGTGSPAFYPPQSPTRPREGVLWAMKPLSALDPNRLSEFWRHHMEAMRAAGAHAFAYEVGNEINTAGFNADYPIKANPMRIPLPACGSEPPCGAIKAGLRAYVDALRVIRDSNTLDGSLLLAAGMAVKRPDADPGPLGSFSPASDAIATLSQFGADPLVDGYAVHVYPNPARASDSGANPVAAEIENAIAQCSAGATAKPCWITEWGLRTRTAGCDPDPDRDAAIRTAMTALRAASAQGRLAGAIYYDWDTSDRLSLYRCGHVIGDPF